MRDLKSKVNLKSGIGSKGRIAHPTVSTLYTVLFALDRIRERITTIRNS